MISVANESLQKDTALAIQTNDNVQRRATRAAHHAATDVTDDLRTAHVWLDAGLSRPSFRDWT